jgi:two-component sensor histidine kinase
MVPYAKTAVTGYESQVDARRTEREGPPGDCGLRQLRHQTKNVLQQIVLRIEQARDLEVTARGRRLLADLQRRVLLSAQISDALFGVTQSPASMSERLRVLSESTIGMLADDMQVIRLDVGVAGDCAESLRQLVLRVAHEFVGNAVKHGMRARVLGTISVHLTTGVDDGTALVVTDDGWGLCGGPDAGEGLTIAGDLAAAAGGTISLRRTHVTVAELRLPSQRSRDGGTGSGFGTTVELRRG